VGSNHKIALFFSFCTGEERATVCHALGNNLLESWVKGATLCQRIAERKKLNAVWLRIDWVTSASRVTWKELCSYIASTKRNYFRHGITLDSEFKHAFLEQELNSNAMLYMGPNTPNGEINKNNFLRY